MKSSEKSITFAVSLKVAVGNVKYVFHIDILANKKQNNISAVGEIFWWSMFNFLKAAVRRCSEKKVFLNISQISPGKFIEKDCSTVVFLKILRNS